MLKDGTLTKDVLRSISMHLSGRSDCKGMEFKVDIFRDKLSGNDVIEVSPYITVFPNTFNRKEKDRRGIAYHVISKHFPEILEDSPSNIVQVKHNALTLGTYIYKKYPLMRMRKWYRI